MGALLKLCGPAKSFRSGLELKRFLEGFLEGLLWGLDPSSLNLLSSGEFKSG